MLGLFIFLSANVDQAGRDLIGLDCYSPDGVADDDEDTDADVHPGDTNLPLSEEPLLTLID